MSKVRKYLDWRTWFIGLYSKSMEAAATAFLTFAGSNTIEQLGVAKVGLTPKGALIQFAFHVGVAAAMYVRSKPIPDVVEETIDTTFTPKQ